MAGEKALKGQFVPSHALKLALLPSETKPRVGDIVSISYQRGRGGDAETITGQYPVKYVVDSHGNTHLVILGEKVRSLASFCW